MTKKFKRVLSIILVMATVFGAAQLIGTTFALDEASTYGYLTFESNYDATEYMVTSCDTVAAGDINVPGTYNGKPVTSIGASAFFDCAEITSITLPETITTIEYNAFGECAKLKSISIPDGVTKMGEYLFSDCESLTAVNIPLGLETIEYGAFYGCTSLEQIIIPDSIERIDSYAFYGCKKLGGILIPESVMSIGANAFYDCAPFNNADNIIENAVYINNCLVGIKSEVASIGIEPHTRVIADETFMSCENLTNVVIPNSVKTIGNSAFYNCSSLKEIAIPESVETIGEYAFSDCSSLEEIVIPEGVKTIGSAAFFNCQNINSVNIPQSVTKIGSVAFVETAYYNNFSNWIDGVLYIDNCLVASQDINSTYNIDAGTRIIADLAFSDNYQLESVTIPASVISIGEYAFCNSGLITVTFEPGSRLTSLGDAAFSQCHYLTEIEIPASVISVSDFLFEGCSALLRVSVPEGVTSIGVRVFKDCEKLVSMAIPASITYIDENAFSECRSLMAITVNADNPNYCSQNGVLYNKDKSVLICYPAKKMDNAFLVQAGVTKICDEAFSNCTGLATITVDSNNAYFSADKGILFNKDKTFLIKSMEENPNITYAIPDSVKTINDYAFQYNVNLENITIPASVEKMGYDAFSYCERLKNVTFIDGSKLKKISDWAFYECCSLESITIPDGVTVIGSGAFCGCDSLENITFATSNNLKSIEDFAFSECISLQRVVIPDGVEEIRYGAFSECTGLEYVHVPSSVVYMDSGVFFGTPYDFYVCSDKSIGVVRTRCLQEGIVYITCFGHENGGTAPAAFLVRILKPIYTAISKIYDLYNIIF